MVYTHIGKVGHHKRFFKIISIRDTYSSKFIEIQQNGMSRRRE